MHVTIVKAGKLHSPGMAEILNQIIEIGGTTANATAVDRDYYWQRMQRLPSRSAWHVAEDETGRIMGFQFIAPEDYLPPEAVDVSTFARPGSTGLGIGSALFSQTELAAKALGYAWINANIRTDNVGGLAYYQSRGFEDYGTLKGVRMSNGLVVDKVLKRYDLT